MPQGLVAPYQVKLHTEDRLIWAPMDCDSVIRALKARRIVKAKRPGAKTEEQEEPPLPPQPPPAAQGHDHAGHAHSGAHFAY